MKLNFGGSKLRGLDVLDTNDSTKTRLIGCQLTWYDFQAKQLLTE